MKKVLQEAGAEQHIRVISKVESIQGLVNYPAILAASDGIMVARGDLGMELPPWKVRTCHARVFVGLKTCA